MCGCVQAIFGKRDLLRRYMPLPGGWLLLARVMGSRSAVGSPENWMGRRVNYVKFAVLLARGSGRTIARAKFVYSPVSA